MPAARHACCQCLPPWHPCALPLPAPLQGSSVTEAQLEEVCARAVATSAGGTTALDAYMQARAELEGLFSSDVSVAFTGVEGGRAEVLVKAVKPGDLPFVSGGCAGHSGARRAAQARSKRSAQSARAEKQHEWMLQPPSKVAPKAACACHLSNCASHSCGCPSS